MNLENSNRFTFLKRKQKSKRFSLKEEKPLIPDKYWKNREIELYQSQLKLDTDFTKPSPSFEGILIIQSHLQLLHHPKNLLAKHTQTRSTFIYIKNSTYSQNTTATL